MRAWRSCAARATWASSPVRRSWRAFSTHSWRRTTRDMHEGDRVADTVREFPGPSGPLEALLNVPPVDARAVVVFAHPLPIEGGTMHTKVVFQSAKAMARIGCAVLRFNFRGVGRSAGTWDDGRGERDDFRAALDFAAGRYPGLQMWAAGFSFGSHIAMTVGAEDERVCTLIGIA